MRIIIDAMGGDNAPDAVVGGVMRAAKELDIDITLVGRGEQILDAMKKRNIDTLPERVEIVNAEDVVDMHDDPTSILHTRKNSSMVIGLKLLADGMGDAFVSAGSSGGLLTAATLLVKRVKGVRRAAFAPILPNKDGNYVLLDAGANNECTPEFLMQFGMLGSIFAQKAMHIAQPRVGLLNNGTEDTKGGPLQREAYALLKKAGDAGRIHFIGNVEAREVPMGAADVVVCDGFSGNVFLKTTEGTAKLMSSFMKKMFLRNLLTKIAALFCKSGVNEIKKKMDYREVGGTIILGLTKPVIKAHGSSDELAMFSSIRQAKQYVQADFCQCVKDRIDEIVLPRN